MQNQSVFDTLISNLLGEDNCNGLVMLLKAYGSINEETDKTINSKEQMQKFLTFFKEIVVNYFVLVLMNPDLFPDMVPQSDEEGLDLSAWRFVQILERGFPSDFLSQINQKISEDDPEQFEELWEKTLIWFFNRFKQINVMGSAKSMADTFINLISDQRIAKKALDLKHFPWIPGPGGINLKGGFGSCTGDNLEQYSPLGALFSTSLFPVSINLKADAKWTDMMSKIKDDLHSAKSAASFDKSAKKYQEIQYKYANSLWACVKQLLKCKEHGAKEDVLRWLAASIMSNDHRTKLGHSLVSNSVKKISNISSDALWYNTLLVLLELCKPFLKPGDKKLEKIDETYIPSEKRIGLSGETAICAKVEEEEKDEQMIDSAFADEEESKESGPLSSKLHYPKEYGTITEFYFMLAETIHYGFIPIIKRGEDVDKLFKRLLEEKDSIGQTHPEYHQMKLEFENMHRFKILYQITLFNRPLIKEVNNFFKVQFEMIKKWGKFDAKKCQLAQDPPSLILRMLPEHFLTDMSDLYQYLFRNDNHAISYFLPEDAIAIFEMAVVIIRSPKAVTNPYIGAKFIEVLSMFTFFEKDVNWLPHFAESEILVENLMEALIQFYVEIEFSGSSGSMYYEKFHYRLDCGSIFKRFWKLKIFKEKFQEMVGSEQMERFINCLLNDTNHWLEEGLSLLGSIKNYETKVGRGQFPKEDEVKAHEKDEGVCKANFQLANECIWIVKQISDWARESFNNEVFTSRMATSLNFVMNKITGPHCIELKVNKPSKYKFVPINLLCDLTHIYSNLSSIDMFVKAVISNDMFKMENSMKAHRILKKNRKYEESLRINEFIKLVTETSASQEQNGDEKLFDEAPDDFLCPIAYCFMRDPVRLPSSGNTVDRSTIKRILLDDEHDPFNRAPLKYAQVEDDTEMRERIQNWINQKRNGQETDEEKREKLEAQMPPMKIHEEPDSNMSVEKSSKENQEQEMDYENLTEEQQMKLAMEMSMKDISEHTFK